MLLATMGKNGRAIFNGRLTSSLEEPDVPKMLKVAWNQQISGLLGG